MTEDLRRGKKRSREEDGQLIKKELWDPPRSAPTLCTDPHCIIASPSPLL